VCSLLEAERSPQATHLGATRWSFPPYLSPTIAVRDARVAHGVCWRWRACACCGLWGAQSIERERRHRQALEEAVAFHSSASGAAVDAEEQLHRHRWSEFNMRESTTRAADVKSLVPHWSWVLASLGVPLAAVAAALWIGRSVLSLYFF
jgi:hypothetical protein